MLTSRLSRLGLALALFACMGAGLSQADAQDAGLARGDAVVTGFSGIRPLDTPVPAGADPLDYFFIDLQGPSAEILSLSALGYGPQGQLAPAPVKRQITAGQVGQVFGVTLDDGLGQDVPNIYLGATSAYGIRIVGPDKNGDGQPDRLKTGAPGATFMAGQFGPAPDGTPGTIWKVDGATGAVTPFATLPNNSGPGIGDIVFDKRTQQFFASDLDNGLIYRIAPDGSVVDSFDHGVSGRPAIGLPPVADNGQVMDITSPAFDTQNPATWGYTQKERMVWGLAVHNDRLYYAVAGGLQVWSVGINADGTFANDPRWELDAKALPGDGPITNILFDGQGRMLLAQRGASRGAYDYSVFAEPGKSSVVRYHLETPDDPATPSRWAPDADEYAIGMRPEFRNADGGIALGYRHDPGTGALVPGSCNATLWSTGSRLRSSANPDAVDDGTGEPDVHGLQGNDASLVRPQNTPPVQSYFIDYDGLFGDAANSGHMGDVAIWQPCTGESFDIEGELPPGYYPFGGEIIVDHFTPPHGHPTNLRLHKRALGHCVHWGAGWACPFAISIRNTGPNWYFGPLAIDDHMPGLPSGSIVGVSPPSWSCGGSPSHFACHHGPTFLPVGASRHLFVVVWVPNSAVKPGRCSVHNRARITFAPGGSVWNTDPSDDADGATATIPAPQCQKHTNLTIRKVSTGCIVAGHGAACSYRVTVINTGPGYYGGTIRVMDQPPAGTTATFAGAPWLCSATSPYLCNDVAANLGAGASTSFDVVLKVPEAVARQHNCRISNTAKILLAPGGSPMNTNPADDSSTATGVVPAAVCAPPPAPDVIHCPPGYHYIDGACRRPHVVRPPERHCPQGTVRRGDRCVPIVRHACPKGTVGTWPNCRQVHVICPRGTVRKGDRCVRIEHHVCPKGTVGTWPNCRRVQVICPRGTVRKGSRCVRIEHHVCPKGTVGTWPHCRRLQVICPKGTVRKGSRCVRIIRHHSCPKGTVGTWPNCRTIQRRTPQLLRVPHATIAPNTRVLR